MLLLKDAVVYGLALYGDGATVKRMPLLNIMCSGFDERCAVLDVVDCTEHMADGEKKCKLHCLSLQSMDRED